MQPVTADELVEHVGRDPRDVGRLLGEFVGDDLIGVSSRRDDDGDVPEFDLTAKGSNTLEMWVFLEERAPGEEP